MFGIIDRYFLAEVFKVFFSVFGAVMLIVVSMLFLRTLEQVNAGALGSDLVLRFIGLQVARDVSSLLPPVFFISVLVALGRMARDSELVAFGACGVGPVRTYRSLLFAAIPVAVLAGWLSLYLTPLVAGEIHELRARQKDQTSQLAGLKAGRFYQPESGNVTVYVDEIKDQGHLAKIFIHDRRDDELRMVLSNEGFLRQDEQTGDQFVTLRDGRRYDGSPGSADYAIGEFERYNLRIEPRELEEFRSSKRAALPTLELIDSEDLGERAELQYRLGTPLAILTLTILSVPLTTKSPRQRGTWRMFLAFLTYFSFFNLQRVATSWFETGFTPVWLGSLWYQAAILLLISVILVPDGHRLKRWLARGSRLRGNAPA
jgi:lipopolysaccharide export system permease protein